MGSRRLFHRLLEHSLGRVEKRHEAARTPSPITLTTLHTASLALAAIYYTLRGGSQFNERYLQEPEPGNNTLMHAPDLDWIPAIYRFPPPREMYITL